MEIFIEEINEKRGKIFTNDWFLVEIYLKVTHSLEKL